MSHVIYRRIEYTLELGIVCITRITLHASCEMCLYLEQRALDTACNV